MKNLVAVLEAAGTKPKKTAVKTLLLPYRYQ